MKNLRSGLVLIGLLSQVPGWSADSNSEGIKAFRAGDYAKAERMYIQALTEESDRSKVASIYRNMALLYTAQGKDGSEFTKKAEKLDPPITPMVVKGKNGDVMIYSGGKHAAEYNDDHPNPYDVPPSAQSTPQQQSPALPAPEQPRRQAYSDPSEGNTPPFFSGFKSSSNYTTSGIGGGFGFSPSRGTNINGGIGGRSSSYAPLPFYPQLGGLQYSSAGPNGSSSYSDSTPIVLPTPYGLPVILNAPGPNIYSNRRGPDGSNTTFMLRTE